MELFKPLEPLKPFKPLEPLKPLEPFKPLKPLKLFTHKTLKLSHAQSNSRSLCL